MRRPDGEGWQLGKSDQEEKVAWLSLGSQQFSAEV